MDIESLSTSPEQPWLSANGKRIPLTSPFNIGRSSKCRHVIASNKASREHTLLQYDDVERHWLLIDLDSTNGTYLNGQRIIRPVPLTDDDEICIGDEKLIFHEPEMAVLKDSDYTCVDPTQVAIASAPCWLLIADVKQSTQLVQQISQEEWCSRLRIWAGECKAIVHDNHGLINEYMGDGLLAFWRDKPELRSVMVQVLKHFNALQSASGMDFRVICHYGVVNIGGGMSSGREKLAGKEINFVFKAEKPAGRTGEKINLTNPAVLRLGSALETFETGDFEISGFTGTHKLFAPRF